VISLGLLAASAFAFDPSAWTDRMRSVNMTSLSVALIRDEEVVATQQIGESGRPVFQVGFLSRIPAIISLMQLVDAKKVDLVKPVNQYLKGWQVPTLGRPVTVADLLTAQSGFSDYKFDGYEVGAPIPPMAELLKAIRPSFAPGTKVDRSAKNELIIQKLLEDVDGQPFAAIAAKRVFTPLGLKQSTYGEPASDTITPGEKPRRVYPQLAAQGLWSSARDIATILAAVMKSARGESKLLSPSSAKRLFTEVKEGATYGLNRFSGANGNAIFLGGQTSGYSCKLRLQPEDGTGVVVLTNADMGWSVINDAEVEAFSRLGKLAVDDSVASFEPRWASGPYAGKEICPVCEYGLLPLAFVWGQNDDDDNLIALAQVLQRGVTAAAPKKLKAFVVLSNLDANLAKAEARAADLARRAATPQVSFLVIKDPDAGPLRSYRIDRASRNVIYLATQRTVRSVFANVAANPDVNAQIEGALAQLVSGN